MLPILVAAVVVLLVAAAVFDWRERRRGDIERTRPEFWRAAAESRRQERRERSTRYFGR